MRTLRQLPSTSAGALERNEEQTMSTITFTATVSDAVRPTTRLRVTARGRRVLLALAALPLATGVAFAALSGGSALASGAESEPATFETVTVMPGDTLWGIASAIAPQVDPREVIGDIERLNLIRGGGLIAGQELAIPAEYSN